MGRPPGPASDELIYHVLNRGNDRRPVFHDGDDFRAPLQALGRTQLRYPFRLFGYCLMSNHVHLLPRTGPGVSVSRVMQSLTVAHTWRHHRQHHSVGHVWQGRFKSPVVQDGGHLRTVLRYIEANPLRADMVADPADWPWSSYPAHALGHPDPLLSPLPEWSDLGADEGARRARWRQMIRFALPGPDLDAIRASLRTGRPFGRPDWSEQVTRALRPGWEVCPRGRPKRKMI